MRKEHEKAQKNENAKKMILQFFGASNRYATLADIRGQKSGGSRDTNQVDWYLRKPGGMDIN
jgi:hypothetical protein